MGWALALAWLCGTGAPTPPPTVGYLWPCRAGAPVPYTPREGDLVFYSRRDLPMVFFYAFARTGHPHHSGVVVRVGDEVMVLESGATVVPGQRVGLLDLPGRFCEHLSHGPDRVIWVRRVKRPLAPDESARLTAFACSQLGKPFASYARLALIALPGRLGGPSSPGQGSWY